MWPASNTAELFFDDCRVPEANLLGKVGEGSHIMLNTLDAGRLSIGAMGLGLAQGAFEMALAYAKEHRIEVTATRLVAANANTTVASLGSGTLVR